jgi:NADH-quinone oxidoreductase subunit M
LCSLGLPGLSGFVAEATVFMGSWQNADTLYRIATILSCASIVVTAVYILRAVGQAIMGPLPKMPDNSLLLWRGAGGEVDAAWNEKFAAAILIIGIVAIGVAPFWLHDLITPGTQNIIQHIISAVTLK